MTPDEARAGLESFLNRAAFFGSDGMPVAQFDEYLARGFLWLSVGGSLLRSALILLRQFDEDLRVRGEPNWHLRADVWNQAIMLAAMAVECALKAVIVETKGASRDGRLTVKDWGTPHNLEDLATRADIQHEDQDEDDAIRRGHAFITWLGRFPSPLSASEFQRDRILDPPRLVSAYRRIFVRAAARVAHEEHKKGALGPDKSRDDHVADVLRRVVGWLDGVTTTE